MTLDFEYLEGLVRDAGRAILEVYATAFDVQEKNDHSPLTVADTRSHDIIAQGLTARYPDIPVLSEEGATIPYSERKNWSYFWLVDPLDGTKEFVQRNGEFTVNIALIEEHRPIVGVIFVPVLDVLYIADVESGAWQITANHRRPLQMQAPPRDMPIRALKSRSRSAPWLEKLLSGLPAYDVTTKGSALKFCDMASGDADLYARLDTTWEWDTAAGQAIVTAAGGVVVDPTGQPLTYNKSHLENGPFLVASSLQWLEDLGLLEAARSLET